MQLPDDFGEPIGDLLKQLVALCERYEVDKGDWFSLAIKLAMAHGEIKPPGDKGGRPKMTGIHHLRDWLKVQKKIDDKLPHLLSVSEACKQARVLRSQYYEIRKHPLVKMMEAVHDDLGPGRFWEVMVSTDWDKEAERIDSLPRDLRLIMSGQRKPPGDLPPTLLSGNPQE